MMSREIKIRTALEAALNPSLLTIIDDSHQHAGHAGASTGLGYYTIIIHSAAFIGKTKLECHRLMYAALGDLMKTDIHAVSLTCKANS